MDSNQNNLNEKDVFTLHYAMHRPLSSVQGTKPYANQDMSTGKNTALIERCLKWDDEWYLCCNYNLKYRARNMKFKMKVQRI